MAPGVACTACATPADFCAPSPAPPWNSLPAPFVQAAGAAALRYFWKLSVVPEESERKIGVMAVSGSVAPAFSAAIAGSFHLVIWPWKILAMVSPLRTRLVDAFDVVGQRDRAEYQRHVPRRVPAAALGGGSDLIVLERRVRTGEVDVACNELLAARARAGRVVRQVLTLAHLAPDLVEHRDGVLLCGGPLGGDRVLAAAVLGGGGGGAGSRCGAAVGALLSLPQPARVIAAIAATETVVPNVLPMQLSFTDPTFL